MVSGGSPHKADRKGSFKAMVGITLDYHFNGSHTFGQVLG